MNSTKPMQPRVKMALEIEKVFDPNGDCPIGTDPFNAICDICDKWLASPAPTGEIDAEAVAKEICDWIINEQAMDADVSKLLIKHYVPDIAAIITGASRGGGKK